MSLLRLSASLNQNQEGEIIEPEAVEPTLELNQDESEVKDLAIFTQGVKIPRLKKYYKKLEKNIFWCVVASFLFCISLATSMVKEIYALWGGQELFSIPFITKSLKDLSGKGLWVQLPITIGLGLFLIWNLWNLYRLIIKKRCISREHSLCKSKYYPTSLTQAFTWRILSLFSWRLNSFWAGFCLCGLGVIAVAYAHLFTAIKMAVSSSSWDMKWYQFKFTKSNKGSDYAAWSGVFGAGGGLVSIIFTNPIFRLLIKRALDIFGLNEYNMGQELREKTFKQNKRNKIICLVILCIAGIGIYIVFKRLIIAVFNRSFKYSRR